ncbi:MAG: protein kinase [Myxococcaceae bacterium]
MGFVADEFTGRTIGRYQLLCRLAVGGMAEIFLGFTKKGPTSYKPVVIKRILPEQREDESALQALIDEAKITATLSHSNVAQVLDLEMAAEEVLLVIEFIRGATLEEVATVYADKKEAVPLGFVLAAMKDCALGINHAHGHRDKAGNPQPIIHRDVTPKNLMVDFDGIGKVLDFGIARAAGAARRTVAGMVRGTSAYMSPEQAIDSKIDTRTDIFSLGIIFHELLTGQRLFYKGNAAKEMAAVYEQEIPLPSSVNRRVPPALDKVVMKALERPMGKRYQNGLDLVRDLQLAAGTTIWPPDRCAELVRTRFNQRRQEILALVTEMSADEGPSISTEPGRPVYQQTAERLAMTAPGVDASTMIVSKPSERKSPSETDESASPTKFFKPEFGDNNGASQQRIAPRDKTLRLGGNDAAAVKMPSMRDLSPMPKGAGRAELPPVPKNASRGQLLATPEPMGPVPQVDDNPTPAPQTLSGVTPGPVDSQSSGQYPAEIPTDSEREAVQRSTISDDVDLPPLKPRKQGVSTGAIIGAAIAALVVGGAGGAVLYRTLSSQPAAVGRVTIGSDKPAEVFLGDQSLGKTPLVDLWMPSGVHQFKLKEDEGPSHALELEVKPNGVTKVSVKLDTLPKVP